MLRSWEVFSDFIVEVCRAIVSPVELSFCILVLKLFPRMAYRALVYVALIFRHEGVCGYHIISCYRFLLEVVVRAAG